MGLQHSRAAAVLVLWSHPWVHLREGVAGPGAPRPLLLRPPECVRRRCVPFRGHSRRGWQAPLQPSPHPDAGHQQRGQGVGGSARRSAQGTPVLRRGLLQGLACTACVRTPNTAMKLHIRMCSNQIRLLKLCSSQLRAPLPLRVRWSNGHRMSCSAASKAYSLPLLSRCRADYTVLRLRELPHGPRSLSRSEASRLHSIWAALTQSELLPHLPSAPLAGAAPTTPKRSASGGGPVADLARPEYLIHMPSHDSSSMHRLLLCGCVQAVVRLGSPSSGPPQLNWLVLRNW